MSALPCGMWVPPTMRECGQPATLCFPAEEGGVIPICDDCITATGTKRRNLWPIPQPSSEDKT